MNVLLFKLHMLKMITFHCKLNQDQKKYYDFICKYYGYRLDRVSNKYKLVR